MNSLHLYFYHIIRIAGRTFGRCSWIRFGLRDKLVRLIENPDQTSGVSFLTTFPRSLPSNKGIYLGNTGSYIDWSVYYFGSYSQAELLFFTSVFSNHTDSILPQGVVLDIGANSGNHSLFYALSGFQVYAFEPNPHTRASLKINIGFNPTLDITCVPIGLSDTSGYLELSLPTGSNLGTASLSSIISNKLLRVPVTTGDAYVVENNITDIVFIKIDVEGHELSVLRGLVHILHRDMPIVFVEINTLLSYDEFKSYFPDRYIFKRFHSDRPLFFLFNRLTCDQTLVHPGQLISPGNYLAQPA